MKAADNYRSLIRGVSEQAPELRPEGQVTEQVNLSADPVQGLSRRFPTLWQNEQLVRAHDGGQAAAFTQMVTDTNNWRTFDYFSQGHDYTMCVRRGARVSTALPVVIVYDRTSKVFLPVVRNVSDTNLDALESGGVSAMTSIGKYVFMAGNSLTATLSSTDVWGSNDNLEKALVWVRGGAYSRRYAVTATKFDNSQISFEYTTPSASYPGLLDTKGVPVYLPDTTGSTTGSGPVLATTVEFVATYPTGGQVYNLIHAADSPSNIQLSGTTTTGAGGDSDYNVTNNYYLINGVDYSYAAGVITILRPLTYVQTITVTYQFVASGGTAATIVYATETTTEAAYITDVNGFGAAILGFKDWQPASLVVRNSQQVMTNVTPATPAAADEYSWADGAPAVVFSQGLVNSQTVTLTYAHIKTLLNPNYSKQINDVTNEYNTKVTKWIGDAARAIQPNNIIIQLQAAAVTAGLTSAVVNGPNLIFDNVKSLAVDDGGDGTLIRGVADEVATVDQVSTTHSVGKVVKVRGKNSKESFYLIATAKDRTVTSGYTEVIWVEGAGSIQAVDAKFIYGSAVAGTFYLAGSASLLATIVPGSPTDIPTYVPSDTGDADTNPPPYFIGRKVTYLGTFQDRLLIGCGGVIRTSKVAEYLTFFRSTVLTLPADDAMEFLSQSAADDELRYSVLYDQNLIVFGLKRQYLINGKQPLTPTNANMVPMMNHADAAELPPLAAGDYIFYGKKGPSSSSVHQIQPGQNTTSPASYIISSQIDLYLRGDAIELASQAKPNTVFLRTAGSRSSVYLFTYFDTPDGRKLDAWHRWDYNPAAGVVVGMQPTAEGLVLISLRATDEGIFAVADLQVMTTGLSQLPYLDSARTLQSITDDPGSVTVDTTGLFVAFDTTSEYQFLGTTLEDAASLSEDHPSAPNETHQWVGYSYEAYVIPTNPFRRDQDGKALTTGNLTVGQFIVSFDRSSGYLYDLTAFRETETVTFNGRLIGDPSNLIGREPVATYKAKLAVGRDSEDFQLKLRSRKWFPFTIKALAWVGQYFNRTVQV